MHSYREKKYISALVNLEGRTHTAQINKDFAEREKELGDMFRACNSEWWPYIMGTECELQVE